MHKKIYFYSNWKQDEWGNGAYRRSHQLYSLIKNYIKNDVELITQALFYPVKFEPFNIFKATSLLMLMQLSKPDIKNLIRSGIIINKIEKMIKKNEFKETIVFWDYSIFGDNRFPLWLKHNGAIVIVLLHNIESLVPNHQNLKDFNVKLYHLKKELSFLKTFDLVTTISQEDNWLLSLFGIYSFYLPYFPSNTVVKELVEIREKREREVSKDFVLMLGTVTNFPSRQGLLDLIKNVKIPDINIVITGYGTQKLDEDLQNDRITIKPNLPWAELKELLSFCRFVIINTLPSSGALTRLIELQIAGVPVIANQHSLRNYHSVSGFHVYNDISELNEILKKQNYDMPEQPNSSNYWKTVEKYFSRITKML